jgi:hypothetical protein
MRKSSRNVVDETKSPWSRPPYAFDDVKFAIREEKGHIEKRLQGLQKLADEDFAAREAAMKRGIERIGLEDAPTTPVAARGADVPTTPITPTTARGAAPKRFHVSDITDPDDYLAAAEEGAQEGILGPVRRLVVLDAETGAGLLGITAKRQPFGRDVFQIGARQVTPGGKFLPSEGVGLQETFNRGELFEIAGSVMDTLGADTLLIFRAGRGTKPFEITRAQVDVAARRRLATQAPVIAAPKAAPPALAAPAAEIGPATARGAGLTPYEAARGARGARTVPGTPAATPETLLVGRLTDVIRGAKRLESPTAKAISRVRGFRARKIENVLRSTSGAEARRRAFGAAKGEIETPIFTPPAGAFTPAEGEVLQEMIRAKFQNDAYLWMPTQKAFEDLFTGGRIPAPRQLQLLEEVFGGDLISAILTQRSRGAKAFELAMELWSVPKALKASYDMSATLRQGAYLLMEGAPAREAFKAQLRAVRSKKGFDAVNEAIVQNPWYLRAVDSGLDMTLPRQARGLLGKEEPFIGAELAKRIPIVGIGVRLSERAYTAFLNKMRMDVFAKYAAKLDASGGTVADFRKLASSINILTGRGELGKLSQASLLLNLPFFSIRYAVSRFQLPLTLATKNPILAKMAVRNFIGYIGFVLQMEALVHFSGVATVEWDPRSSDFLKIRRGNTRLDPFAGFQQPVVLITQLIAGRKSVDTGDVQRVDPTQRVGQFLETKLTPSASGIISAKRGKRYGGAELTAATFFYDLLAPMPIGDVWEAIDDLGPIEGSLFGTAGVLGTGVQTFGMPDWKDDFKGYIKIPSDDIERQIKNIGTNRDEYRKTHPNVDAKLWITGQVTSLKSAVAVEVVKRLVREHNIDPKDIKAVRERLKLEKRMRSAGVIEGTLTGSKLRTRTLIRALLPQEQGVR